MTITPLCSFTARTVDGVIPNDCLTCAGILNEPLTVLTVKKVPLSLAPGSWQKLTLKFDGINLDGEIGGTKFSATDKIFEREKGGVDFLLTGGTAGFRNFSLTPAVPRK